MVFYCVTAALAFALLLAVWLLHKETTLRKSLQTLLARLLKKWRANEEND